MLTDSIQETIKDNERKIQIQKKYNQQNKITPKPLIKKIHSMSHFISNKKKYQDKEIDEKALNKMSLVDLKKKAKETKKLMHDAAIAMDFLEAAKLRDYLFMLEKKITNF